MIQRSVLGGRMCVNWFMVRVYGCDFGSLGVVWLFVDTMCRVWSTHRSDCRFGVWNYQLWEIMLLDM